MGTRIVKIGVFAAASLLAAAFAAVPPATADGQDPADGEAARSDTHRVLDSLGGARVEGVGADQCGLPESDRQGSWMCFDPPVTSDGDITTMATDTGNHCEVEGCWTVTDAYHAKFHGNGTFGYGSQFAADMAFDLRFALNGAQFQSTKVAFWSNVSLSKAEVWGDLLYGPRDTTGDAILSQTEHHSWGPTVSSVWQTWKYNSYDRTRDNHANAHEYHWQLRPTYPGTWYFVVKSNIARDVDHELYRFIDKDVLFNNPAESGWMSD